MADKDGDDGTTHKVVVRVTSDADEAQRETAAEEARRAYAVAVEELDGLPHAGAWVVGDELSEMMWVRQSKLKEAHEKLLQAMTQLRESGDLSQEGWNRLESLLDELAADLESGHQWSAVGKAIELTAPEIEMRDGEAHKIIVEKLMKGDDEGRRQLKIVIDGDDIEVEGEGLSEEELAQIERELAAGSDSIVIGGDPLFLHGPEHELKRLGEHELQELLEQEGLLELELKGLDEELRKLELEHRELMPPAAPMPGKPHRLIFEELPKWHGVDSDTWHKEWQALEEELQQVLSDEQLAKLHKLMQEHPWPTHELPEHFFEFYAPGEGEWPAPQWEEERDIFRNYAPQATPFFEWPGGELGEDWEAELETMMDQIEQMMKELMLRYQEYETH